MQGALSGHGVPPHRAAQPGGGRGRGERRQGEGARAARVGPGEPGRAPVPGADRHGAGEAVADGDPRRAAGPPGAHGVDGIAEQDQERVGGGVEDEGGTGESGVAGGVRGGHGSHVPVLVELESEAVVVAGEGRVVVGEEQLDGGGAQDALARVDPAVEEGAGEDGEVPGGAEDPGVARDPAERVRVLVVHLAPHQTAVQPGPGRALHLSGGGDPAPGERWVVTSAVHPERSGDLVAEQDVQCASGDLFQEQLEGDQVQVGVPVDGPGSLLWAHRPQQPQPALACGLLVEGRPGAQSRGVGEQLTHRDHLFAAPGEVRQVPAHRSLQLQASPLHLLHGQDGGEQLGQRGQVEDGVLGHRDPLGRRELPHPVGPPVVVRVPDGVAHRAVQRDGAAPAG